LRARTHTHPVPNRQHSCNTTLFFTVVCILIRFSLSYVCTCACACTRVRMRTHTHTPCVHGHCMRQGAELCGSGFNPIFWQVTLCSMVHRYRCFFQRIRLPPPKGRYRQDYLLLDYSATPLWLHRQKVGYMNFVRSTSVHYKISILCNKPTNAHQ
jgi:hypothetical protein